MDNNMLSKHFNLKDLIQSFFESRREIKILRFTLLGCKHLNYFQTLAFID